MRTLFNWLVPPLRPIEKNILEAVQAKLDAVRAQMFGAQVRDINYVQRRLGGREVGLYVIRSGRVRRNPSLRLPMAGREWCLARLRLRSTGLTWIATVHLVDGHVCSIEYDGAVPSVDVEGATMDVEIFEPPLSAPRPSGSPPVLPTWLQAYADHLGITTIDSPLTAEDRDTIVGRLEATFPADYLDFLANCDGVQIGSLSVAGSSEAYETRTEDGEYIVIGQMNGKGAFAVRKPGPTIVFLDFEDDSITELGESLQAAIEHVMRTAP